MVPQIQFEKGKKKHAADSQLPHFLTLVINPVYFRKGTKQHADGWDASTKAWAHMVLHLPHTEGSYGVNFKDVTEDVVFYTTISRFVV